MSVERVEEVLEAVSEVRIPASLRAGEEQTGFDYDLKEEVTKLQPLSVTAKVEKLEDYLLETAEARADATSARLIMQRSLRVLRRQWRDLKGWEGHMNGTPPEKWTGPQIDRAKALVNNDLYESIQTAEWLEARLSEQIKRLQHDDDVASRVYTLLTGG